MSVSNDFLAINTDFDAFSGISLQPARKVKAQMPLSRWDPDISGPAEKFSTIGPARSSKSNGFSRLIVHTHAGYRWEVLPRAFSGERALDHATKYARTLEHQRYWSRQFDDMSRIIKEDRCPDLKIVFLKVFSHGSNRAAHPSADRFPYTSLYAISSVYVDPFNLLGAKFCGTDETTIRSGINGDIFIVIEMEILEALYSGKAKTSTS
ncbi:MAG TPA: hypothetical protein VE860_03365 [Chthoniobacterales bacterium]|nr:hypothetical protein [Chthoniobacterales bacterium]